MTLSIDQALDMFDAARAAFNAGKPERPALWVMTKAAFDHLSEEADAVMPVISFNAEDRSQPKIFGIDVYLDDMQFLPALLDQAEAARYLDTRTQTL